MKFVYYKEMPKYIPMKPQDIARLSSEDRQEYEKSLKIQKTPNRYVLTTGLTNFVNILQK
jgi:hypothetical protein